MQSNARKGGNAAEGGYKPAVQRMEVKGYGKDNR